MRNHDYDDEPYVVIEKQSGSVSSFLIGLAVGAGLALLFAPQSRGARRARAAAVDAVEGVTEQVQDTFAAARDRVEEKLEEAREAIDTKRDQVQRAVDAGREAARVARSDLERRLAETKAAYSAGAQVARDARTERSVARAAKDDAGTL
jgi:gas vesicle protein